MPPVTPQSGAAAPSTVAPEPTTRELIEAAVATLTEHGKKLFLLDIWHIVLALPLSAWLAAATFVGSTLGAGKFVESKFFGPATVKRERPSGLQLAKDETDRPNRVLNSVDQALWSEMAATNKRPDEGLLVIRLQSRPFAQPTSPFTVQLSPNIGNIINAVCFRTHREETSNQPMLQPLTSHIANGKVTIDVTDAEQNDTVMMYVSVLLPKGTKPHIDTLFSTEVPK